MSNISATLSAALQLMRSRLFAVLMLSVACAIMVLSIILTSHVVTISDGDTIQTFITMKKETQEILEEAKITVNKDDIVNTDASSSKHISISITRAFDVVVKCDGETIPLRVTGGTVASALEQAGVNLNPTDEVNYPLHQRLSENLQICVDRVTFRTTTKTEKIPYKIEKKDTPLLKKGYTRVYVKGQEGIKTYTYEEKLVNGQVVETKLKNETITKAPVNELRLTGNGQVEVLSTLKPSKEILLDSKGFPVNYKKVLKGKATAYTGVGDPTSTGVKTRVGYVAVDPKIIPYGSELYIISPDGKVVYGYAIAADTGGAMLSGRILVDVFFNTEEECRAFGVRNMLVYILN